MVEGLNEDFGLPPVQVVETEEQRLERLRKAAAAVVAKETDEALLKRMIAEERAKTVPVALVEQGFPAKYSRVIIYQGPGKQDQDFVPLGINGNTVKVPRGVEVILQNCYIEECLERAVEEITVKSFGGYTTRPSHRFQWKIVSSATPEEYRVFMEGQKAKATREIAQSAVA